MLALLCFAATSLAGGSSASAQSITRGTLEGTVRDNAGVAYRGAWIRVEERATGVSWSARTSNIGEFQISLLEPGEYDVLVEDIGYRPVRLESVPVRPGQRRHISVTLQPVQLPVDQVEIVRFADRAADSRAGVSQWYAPFEIFDLPEGRRGLSELGRLSSVSDSELATEGLPSRLSNLVVDGSLYSLARHADLPPDPLAGEAFPLSGFATAELVTNGVDVEWSGAAGGYLSGYTRRGTARPALSAYGDWSGTAVTTSDQFEAQDIDANSFRGGLVMSGPVVPDTAHFVLGIEAQRLERPLPRPWVVNTLDAELLTVAESLGADLGPYLQPRVSDIDAISAFGRFDWQITGGSALSVRGDFASFEVGGGEDLDPDLGRGASASLGSKLEGLNFSAAATLASHLHAGVSQELRFAVDGGEREYTGTSITGTRIVDGGFAFGTDPTIPGIFKRLAVHGSETLHYTLGRHQLKGGVALAYDNFEQRYVYAQGGLYTFAGIDELRRQEGVFSIAEGSPAAAKFQSWQFAAYLQDTWSATRGLDVTFGLRYEFELLDDGEVRLNEEWQELTGIANTELDDDIGKWSPRFGFLWNISERNEWLVRGAAGLYHDRVDPGLFGELVTLDNPVAIRRGVGGLDGWPAAASLGTAPAAGTRLTLFGPEFRPPQTARASLGISRVFGDRTAVHLSGTYRYTDRLPRHGDLNRPLAPSARDQHGRPIFGKLVKQGSLLAVEPGSNRRFPDFDLVSAIDADGTSEYWDVTLAIERHASDWLALLARYTYSWTQDDWLAGRGGGPEVQLNPFPDGLLDDDWADDRSDFHQPHRAVVGAELRFPDALSGVRLAALYRFRSGLPFTPGFQSGVDVNGDGSALNDPAFVDANVPGMDTLLDQWDCLTDQVGQFAERNSCRAPDLHFLDARLALGVFELQGRPVEIVVDLLNLLDTDTGVRDPALFLLDREETLQTSPDGTITLPLVANPNFGEELVQRTSGRAFRFGARVGL